MNMKRMRGRNNRGGGGGGGGGPVRHQSGNTPMNRNHVFDSSGPDLRIRGTSQQLFEKYLQLGRDATSSGDRVMAESYFQYAEHYFRIMTAMNQAAQQSGQAPQAGPQHGGSQYGGSQGGGYGNQQGSYNQQQQRRAEGGFDQGDGDEDGPDGPEPRPIPIATGAPEPAAE